MKKFLQFLTESDRRYLFDYFDNRQFSKIPPKGQERVERLFGEFKKGGIVSSDTFNGQTGNRQHITRRDDVWLPTETLTGLEGAMGEVRQYHARGFGNYSSTEWKNFKKDILENGFKESVFIVVDYGRKPRISEGNHRVAAADQLGITHVPCEVRYFGNANLEDGKVLGE